MNDPTHETPVGHPIDGAARVLGSQVALAALLGVSKAAVNQWKHAGRRVPAEHCPSIERATHGAVRCEDLRPDIDWAVLRAMPLMGAGERVVQDPSPDGGDQAIPPAEPALWPLSTDRRVEPRTTEAPHA
jgi:DNA-binding transcriptional regulator YdaS (Cro superfamily)